MNDVDDQIYIGSTTKPFLSQRWAGHCYQFRLFAAGGRRMKLFEHMLAIGPEHFKIVLIEQYPCQSKDELRAREAHYIVTVSPALNERIPGGTRHDWNYRYEQRHPEQVRAKRQRENQDPRRLAKNECECGGRYATKHKQAHFRTDRHQQYLSIKE